MTTLLDMTQDILSEMNGDEVNSIFDTEEAEQVAKFIINTYKAMVSRDIVPYTQEGSQLIARSDLSFPTHMILPDGVQEVKSLRYDKIKQGETRKNYQPVKYVDSDTFLRKINSRNSSDANTIVVTNDDGIELLILNNKAPDYYTSFNQTDLIFDSYDSDVDSTLQESKVQAIVQTIPVLLLSDDSVLPVPVDVESAMYEEALARAQYKIKEFQDIKAEQEATRQRRALSRKSWRAGKPDRYPNYGRKR